MKKLDLVTKAIALTFVLRHREYSKADFETNVENLLEVVDELLANLKKEAKKKELEATVKAFVEWKFNA